LKKRIGFLVVFALLASLASLAFTSIASADDTVIPAPVLEVAAVDEEVEAGVTGAWTIPRLASSVYSAIVTLPTAMASTVPRAASSEALTAVTLVAILGLGIVALTIHRTQLTSAWRIGSRIAASTIATITAFGLKVLASGPSFARG